MGRFVKRIEREPPPGIGQGTRGVPLSSLSANQPLQCGGQLMAHFLRLEELPLIKGETVTQAKSLEEISPIECSGFCQGFEASRTNLFWWMGVILPGVHVLDELLHI